MLGDKTPLQLMKLRKVLFVVPADKRINEKENKMISKLIRVPVEIHPKLFKHYKHTFKTLFC